MTFKDLKRIIAEKKKEAEQESKFYDASHYWKGKKIVSLNEWLKIKNNYGLNTALQYFPNDFPRSGLTFILYGIEDQTLKQEADQWGSDFIKLLEYRKSPEYGKWKCCRCLLSTDREEAGIFIGMNKIISRTLDADAVSIYPCKILNRFACPYDKKITKDTLDDGITKKPALSFQTSSIRPTSIHFSLLNLPHSELAIYFGLTLDVINILSFVSVWIASAV